MVLWRITTSIAISPPQIVRKSVKILATDPALILPRYQSAIMAVSFGLQWCVWWFDVERIYSMGCVAGLPHATFTFLIGTFTMFFWPRFFGVAH
jgi:hypothetical protein